MSDKEKTKAELIAEITSLREHLASLEKQGGERRRHDQRTQKIEERYAMLVEQSRDAIYLFYDRRFEYVNQRFEQLFGYKREELYQPGFDVYKIFSAGDREKFSRLLEGSDAAKTIYPLYEFTGITKDGRQIAIELSVAYVPYKAGTAIQGIARDITMRKRMDAALQTSEKKFREFAELLPGSAFECDSNFQVTFINRNALKTFGYTREDIAAGFNLLKVVKPDNLDYVLKRYKDMLNGLLREPTEITCLRKDGSELIVHLSAAPIIVEGKPVGLRGVAIDITEHKDREMALRRSEGRYRSIMETIEDGFYEIDLHGHFTDFNESALKLLSSEREELKGSSFKDFFTPESCSQLFAEFNKIYLTGIPGRGLELIRLRDDNTKQIGELSTSLMRDENGVPVGFIGIARDITEKKKREAELQKSEERYRTIIETIEDGYYEFDLDGNFTFFNEACRKLLEFPPEEMKGLNFRQYTSKEDAEKLLNVAKKVYRTGRPESSSDVGVITKSGSQKYIEISVSLVRDAEGNPVGFRGIARDVTERKKIENELRESRERFKNMVANVPGIIYQFIIHHDGSYSIPYISDSVGQLGINVQEFIKDPFKVFNVIDQEEKERISANIADRMNLLSRWIWEGEIRINNESKRLRIVAQPRLLENNDVLYDGLIIDMTEMKHAEEERKELEARLQQSQKMEAIGTLAGGIAHDFNNLLMGIQGHISLMLLDTDPLHPHYRKLKSVEELISSGANLTRQLLGFARRGRYEVKPTNLNELIDKTTTLFGWTKKEVFIYRLFAKDLWTVEVDQGQIEQVLLNLYVNAWQAMPGGGYLYLETKNVALTKDEAQQYALPAGRYVKVSITDTGVGMDEVTRERIFEPFFTTKEMGRGTGLGLATVYGIIKGHSGMINVFSEKGIGSTFNIYLPVTEKEFIAEQKPAESLLKGHETVLLIDDEESVINVTTELLEALGYKVISATSGSKAVETYLLNSGGIDVVILDMIMPGMNGSETFDALRAIDPEVKVILSSGYSIDGEAAEIMKKGCLAFIQKPFSIADISKKIREALDKK